MAGDRIARLRSDVTTPAATATGEPMCSTVDILAVCDDLERLQVELREVRRHVNCWCHKTDDSCPLHRCYVLAGMIDEGDADRG